MADVNQDNICAAVRIFLSNRFGVPLAVAARPDVVERNLQAVEEVWRSPIGLLAVEHTRVEAFEGQVRDDKAFLRLLEPVQPATAGRVPGTFAIRIDVGVASKARVKVEDAQRVIIEWVLAEAATMAIGESRTLGKPHLPFIVTLRRERAQGAKVLAGRFLPADFSIDDQRPVRIRRALLDKCPKLAQWAKGGESVLILESNDLPLSNHVEIGHSVVTELAAVSDVPNHIIVVETELWPELVLWVVKEHGHVFPHIADAGPHYVDADGKFVDAAV
jgi:hypothetical protein